MRTALAAVSAAGVAIATAVVAGPTTAGASGSAASGSTVADGGTSYVVAYRSAADAAAARAAVTAAGGTVTGENAKIGYLVATASDSRFAGRVDASPAVTGAARNRVIGWTPHATKDDSVESQATVKQEGYRGSADAAPTPTKAEPLANRQWDMRQVGATPAGSYAVNQGSKGVLVGVIDTGVDGSHPDIAPNFDAARSRNFTTDMPDIDGPCEHPGCKDPADEDDDGHGTHVASTIGSPINGLGIAGVAPNVTLVNIRAGQDSGYFFLQPTLDALTYAGDIGVDVVNMSYYTDPWLYNCLSNPADSPAEQAEQRTIRELTQRAMDYARHRNVLPVAAEGNEATDLGNPTFDDTSPDYPAGAAKDRTVDNSCITVPTETRGVVAVSSTGQSTRKAYYSNYGTEQTDVAAPGGDVYDAFDNTRDIRGAVLAAYPKHLAEENGQLNPDGTPNTPSVVRDCTGTGAAQVCGYYQYLQGTSMAAPHAVGVAALVISRYGKADRVNGGLTLAPAAAQATLFNTAVEHACPSPRLFHYDRILPSGALRTADHYCAGGTQNNGFYGHGIVNAYNAVAGHRSEP